MLCDENVDLDQMIIRYIDGWKGHITRTVILANSGQVSNSQPVRMQALLRTGAYIRGNI